MFKEIIKKIIGNPKTKAEWCETFEFTRTVTRSLDFAKIVSENDLDGVDKYAQIGFEAVANSIQDKYSCKEPESILLKRENYLDPVGNAKDKLLRWSFNKTLQGVKSTFEFTKNFTKALPFALKNITIVS